MAVSIQTFSPDAVNVFYNRLSKVTSWNDLSQMNWLVLLTATAEVAETRSSTSLLDYFHFDGAVSDSLSTQTVGLNLKIIYMSK